MKKKAHNYQHSQKLDGDSIFYQLHSNRAKTELV